LKLFLKSKIIYKKEEKMGKNSKQSFIKKTRILKIPTLTLFSMILVLIITMNIVGCAMVTSTFKSLKTNEIAKETPYALEEKILLEEAEKSDRAEYIETEVAAEVLHVVH